MRDLMLWLSEVIIPAVVCFIVIMFIIFGSVLFGQLNDEQAKDRVTHCELSRISNTKPYLYTCP